MVSDLSSRRRPLDITFLSLKISYFFRPVSEFIDTLMVSSVTYTLFLQLFLPLSFSLFFSWVPEDVFREDLRISSSQCHTGPEVTVLVLPFQIMNDFWGPLKVPYNKS